MPLLISRDAGGIATRKWRERIGGAHGRQVVGVVKVDIIPARGGTLTWTRQDAELESVLESETASGFHRTMCSEGLHRLRKTFMSAGLDAASAVTSDIDLICTYIPQ